MSINAIQNDYSPRVRILYKLNLRPEDWFYYGQWEQPPFSAWFWARWYEEKTALQLGLPKLDGRIFLINGHHLVHRGDLELLQAELERACQAKDEDFFTNLTVSAKQIFAENQKLIRQLQKCAAIDLPLFKACIAALTRLMVPWYSGLILSDHLGEIILVKARELGCSATDVAASIPKQTTIMIQEHAEALSIKRQLEEKNLLPELNNSTSIGLTRIKADPDLFAAVQRHVEKYQWIGTHHFWGEPLSIEKFLSELPFLEQKTPREYPDHLPKELDFVIKQSAEIAWLRQYTPEMFDILAFQARPLLAAIASRFGLSYRELLYFTPTEICAALDNKTVLSRESVAYRNKNYCVLMSAGEENIIDNPLEVQELINTFIPAKSTAAVREFRGTVAAPGKARGKAKIFIVPENLDKMNEGDILVTPMTSPDFIPLMKKAAAIVTDIGGLLSHAALVSRELQKPCIIGTKIATQVLKDGDSIEVDAEQGIVRKLS